MKTVKKAEDLIQWTLKNIIKKRGVTIVAKKRETAIIIYYDPATMTIMEDGGDET